MEHRTELERLRIARGMTWREMARAVEKQSGFRVTGEHLNRLGTGSREGASPSLAHALEVTFGVPASILLAPPTGTLQTPVGDDSARRRLAMAADRARDLGLNLPPVEDYGLIEDECRELANAYPVTPLPQLINPLVNLQDTIYAALAEPRPGDTRNLYALAAISGGMLGKASHDLHDPRAAGTQIRTATLLAERAGHVQLAAWLQGLYALVAYWDSRPRDSIRAAQKGLASGASGSTALWLHVSEARAWARMGNVDATGDAARRARETADTMEPGELDDLGGMLTFTRARADYYLADAYAWLPEAAEGPSTAETAVAAYADPRAVDWSFGDAAGSDCARAIARLHSGEVDGAAEAVAPVLALPREKRIHGIITSVERVSAALHTAPASSARDDLADALEDFTRAPMVMTP